jgi:hypothetical protein
VAQQPSVHLRLTTTLSAAFDLAVAETLCLRSARVRGSRRSSRGRTYAKRASRKPLQEMRLPHVVGCLLEDTHPISPIEEEPLFLDGRWFRRKFTGG